MDEKMRLTLLKNLLYRMDYNENQKSWRLIGNITSDEYQSLQDAVESYNRFIVQQIKRPF